MAKKTSRSGSNKHYPVQRTWRFDHTLPNLATEYSGSADLELSRLNHRLYRQSRVYELKVDLDADLPDGSVAYVYALSDTWMNQKAYQEAYDQFKKNSSQEMEALNQEKARWHDFRVALGITSPGSQNLVGYNAVGTPTGVAYGGFEYVMTEVSDSTGAQKTFRWVGSDSASFNIIDEYDISGNTDVTPNDPSTAVPYDGLEDELDDNQINHIAGDGNAPPYDRTGLENQCLTLVATLHVDATGTSKLSSGFFKAPCGIYVIRYAGTLDNIQAGNSIQVTAKAGDYKGVAGAEYLEI